MSDALHFERHAPAPQFVGLRRSQRTLTRTFGRIGTLGTTRVTEHRDEAETKRALAGQALRLERSGYLIGHQHPALLAAICAQPEVLTPYSVYADWLLERQDPRGELIAHMIAGAGTRVRELVAQNEAQLSPAWWAARGWQGEWRWGFLRKMTCPHFESGSVRRLLRHPSAVVLEELSFGSPSYWGELLLGLRDRPATLRRIVMPSNQITTGLAGRVPGLVLV